MASKAYELIAGIRDLLMIDGTGEDTKILRRLNDAQWKVYHANPNWRGLQGYPTTTTSDGVSYVAMPSTLHHIYDVRQTSTSPETQLKYVSPSEFHKIIPQPTTFAEGSPTYYSLWGERLWLYPIPDATYTLTIYGYLKPVSCKVYSTGTSQHSSTTVTGTSTYFSTNANVDTTMFYAYQADVRSDGTYPWSTISAVTNATAMTISAYSGGSGSAAIAYAASSASTFPEQFDWLLKVTAALMMSGRLREQELFIKWLLEEERKALASLIDSETYVPDFKPVLEDFRQVSELPSGNDYMYPFIFRDR